MVSKASIPHVLLFYRCCLRQRQQHCLEGRDHFCEQHSGIRRYDREMFSLMYLTYTEGYFPKTYFGRVSRAI